MTDPLRTALHQTWVRLNNFFPPLHWYPRGCIRTIKTWEYSLWKHGRLHISMYQGFNDSAVDILNDLINALMNPHHRADVRVFLALNFFFLRHSCAPRLNRIST